MLPLLRNLLAHCEWANGVFFHAWGKSPARDHEEMRRRLDHLVGVQQGFLAVFRGERPGGPPDGPPDSYDGLKARAQTCHAGLAVFAAGLTPDGLTRPVHIPWFGEPPLHIAVADALVQLCMHSQHHRGQCMTRLKDHGGEPKNVDYIV
ncbi:MAG TPA: DinB family protein, partial [Gemmatales bacterium]|nr:DinB family protein [Gemmatales bacterium]